MLNSSLFAYVNTRGVKISKKGKGRKNDGDEKGWVLTAKQTPLLRLMFAVWISAPCIFRDSLWLIKGYTQALGTHTRRLGILWCFIILRRLSRAQLLYLVLTFLRQAKWN